MTKWVSTKVGMPNSEIPCVLLCKCVDTLDVYPKFAQWDGLHWIDIDGDVVTGVIAWTKAPEYNAKAMEAFSKLAGCANNDKCEEKDCCYFVTLDLIEQLLEYIDE